MKALALEQNQPTAKIESLPTLIGAAVVATAVVWAYWPTLGTLAGVWSRDAQYSHGWLVPLFAAGLLWYRRDMLESVSTGRRFWGLAILLASAGLRFVGVYFYIPWLDMVSLLPCLVGLVVLWGGMAGLRWAWPGIAFLLFMLPLPWRVGTFMAPTLQRFATITSTYLLQTFGFPAISEGNIILLHESRIGVVEACGGLSMLIVFFALSTAVALMVRRDWLDKIMIVASALPIAVVSNVIRITATAVVHDQCGSAAGDMFHDIAGWLMMPLALAMLWLELQLLPRLMPAARQPAY
jgi:exosortase